MNSHTTLNNAISYASAGNTKKAVRLVKEILAQDAQNDRAWVLLADLCGEPTRAEKYLETALKINPQNQQVCSRLAGYVSTAKCKEVLGISSEEFKNFLGAEEVAVPSGLYSGRRDVRSKTSAARVNVPFFLVLILMAAYLYLAKPDMHLPFGWGQVQAASAQGSGAVYQAQPGSTVSVPAAYPVVAAAGSANEVPAPTPVVYFHSSSIPQSKFVTFLEKLDESGAKLLIIPNR